VQADASTLSPSSVFKTCQPTFPYFYVKSGTFLVAPPPIAPTVPCGDNENSELCKCPLPPSAGAWGQKPSWYHDTLALSTTDIAITTKPAPAATADHVPALAASGAALVLVAIAGAVFRMRNHQASLGTNVAAETEMQQNPGVNELPVTVDDASAL